ncbi:MAG: ABC transporter permease [Actinomycetota bacterium]|nr:ABC transporter permease [Actinomycetota bacterium]
MATAAPRTELRPSPSAGSRGDPRRRDRNWVLALVVLLVAEVLYFSVTVSGFFGNGTGLLALTEQFLDIGAIALGLSVVILAGEIDLSAGTMSSFAGIVMAVLWRDGMEIWLAVVVALLLSAAVGAVNGLITTFFKVDSLLVTLAMQFILGSVATALGGASPPYGFPSSFVTIAGTGTVGPIPNQLIVFAVLAIVVSLLVGRTRVGRSLALIGYNRPAARYSGIRVNRTIVGAFVVSGLMAGIGGILVSGLYNAARNDIGDSLLLPGITVVVLGGVDIFGGKGRISGVIVATFVLGFLTEGLLVAGDSSLSATMVTGILLLVALAFKIGLDRRGGVDVVAVVRRRLRRIPVAGEPS